MTRRSRVAIAAPMRRAMIAHARRDAPRECCGLLLGAGRTVRHVLPLPNVDAQPLVRYRIDARTHIEVRRVLRQLAPPLDIVGVYHSHPRGPATPSASDVAEALYPEWLYVIVDLSTRRPCVRAFAITGGAAVPVSRARAPWRRSR